MTEIIVRDVRLKLTDNIARWDQNIMYKFIFS